MRKPIYFSAGSTTTFFGPGRKEFNPKKPMPSFEEYIKEAAKGCVDQIPRPSFNEGIIGSFMPGQFIHQANLAGFLPFVMPDLLGKPCTAVEGACGTGGRALAMGAASILSDLSSATYVTAFEIQNTVKSVYGADILAGAGYYSGHRKSGHAHFFPGSFSDRAAAYFKKYGQEKTRKAMAKWYENSIVNARKNPKAQEFHNQTEDLFKLGMTPPNPKAFLPCLNLYDCSKITDGAASIGVFDEEGLKKSGIEKKDAVELVSMGAAEGDITKDPDDLTFLTTTSIAVKKALDSAGISLDEIGILEVHDCFSITGLLSLEAAGFAEKGGAPEFIFSGATLKDGSIPTNLSGGLGGFGHPTGASGVRQMVDLWMQLTGRAPNQAALKKPYGMMISMGGNDITVTCLVVK